MKYIISMTAHGPHHTLNLLTHRPVFCHAAHTPCEKDEALLYELIHNYYSFILRTRSGMLSVSSTEYREKRRFGMI